GARVHDRPPWPLRAAPTIVLHNVLCDSGSRGGHGNGDEPGARRQADRRGGPRGGAQEQEGGGDGGPRPVRENTEAPGGTPLEGPGRVLRRLRLQSPAPASGLMVLVDTSIWSLALRRRPAALTLAEEGVVDEWTGLVSEGLAGLIGPIRQEILSGVKRVEVFE